ncbi:MAG: HAD family hydrolase [Candidatus Aenigmarchaeota archaeon]|nr:HAD family hydrolase [Candidatus Aenigmarchaeota archaeon]
MIRAVIFDLWDTLIYSEAGNPVQKARELLGYDKSFEEFMAKFQSSLMTRQFPSFKAAFAYVCGEFGVSDASVEEKLASIWEENVRKVRLFPETREVLHKLKEKRYKLGIVSNGYAGAHSMIKGLGIYDCFDAVIVSCDIGLVKPDPRIYRTALERLGVTAEQAVMVGDRIADDIEGAGKAGIRGVLVDRQGRSDYYPKMFSLRETVLFLPYSPQS